MGLTIEGTLVVLLLVAAVVAIVSQRVHLPYSVGLVTAGIILSLLPFSPQIVLTRQLLFDTLLPPLIFQAALSLHWSELRRDLPVILTLATLGIAISASITAGAMHTLAQWPWLSAMIFGILIAATDPVSVIAVFREARVGERLRLLMESESLFNDGTAAVGFAIAVSLVTDAPLTWTAILSSTLITIAGGVLCGALLAGIMLSFAGRTQDHLVELTFSTVSAYGSFILAEHFHASGVLATLTAGLLMGNVGRLRMLSERGKVAVMAFWEFVAFLSNSLIFLLIGMQQSHLNLRNAGVGVPIAVGFVVLGRAGAVYPSCLLFSNSSLRVPWKNQHVLFWGGLRGGLALALALALPSRLPFRDDIIMVSFAVVAFSIFIQALTMRPFLRVLGEIPPRRAKDPEPSPKAVE